MHFAFMLKGSTKLHDFAPHKRNDQLLYVLKGIKIQRKHIIHKYRLKYKEKFAKMQIFKFSNLVLYSVKALERQFTAISLNCCYELHNTITLFF